MHYFQFFVCLTTCMDFQEIIDFTILRLQLPIVTISHIRDQFKCILNFKVPYFVS